jgi:hypothetical protein
VLTWGYRSDLFDRLKVISSGSVVMKIDAKVGFPRWHAIWQPYMKSDQIKIWRKYRWCLVTCPYKV